MSKMYKLEVYVIDLEGHGMEEIIRCIENCRFVYPSVMDAQEADIGEWTDEHIFNKRDTPVWKYREVFDRSQKADAFPQERKEVNPVAK